MHLTPEHVMPAQLVSSLSCALLSNASMKIPALQPVDWKEDLFQQVKAP